MINILLNGEKIMRISKYDVLKVSARAAAAGVTDTGIAADAITTILNAYSMSAEEAGYGKVCGNCAFFNKNHCKLTGKKKIESKK